MNYFGRGLGMLQTALSLKTIAICVVGSLGIWMVMDILNAKAKAAVMTERNQYLLDLHADRDRSEAAVSAARSSLSAANAELLSDIQRIESERRATLDAIQAQPEQCPVECRLIPVGN